MRRNRDVSLEPLIVRKRQPSQLHGWIDQIALPLSVYDWWGRFGAQRPRAKRTSEKVRMRILMSSQRDQFSM